MKENKSHDNLPPEDPPILLDQRSGNQLSISFSLNDPIDVLVILAMKLKKLNLPFVTLPYYPIGECLNSLEKYLREHKQTNEDVRVILLPYHIEIHFIVGLIIDLNAKGNISKVNFINPMLEVDCLPYLETTIQKASKVYPELPDIALQEIKGSRCRNVSYSGCLTVKNLIAFGASKNLAESI